MLTSTTLRKLAAASAASACALVGVQSIAIVPASAMLSFPFDGQVAPASGSFGRSEAGGPVLAFLVPDGVAINDFNGETYVAEEVNSQANPQGDNAVAVLAAGGAELSPLDGGATPAGSLGNGNIAVAANNGTGAVYVMDSADNAVDVFDSSGNYVCQITGAGSASTSPSECDASTSSAENPPTPAGGFHEPRGVAVDQATGEVFVLDNQNGVVDIFSGAGAYERQIELSQAPNGNPGVMHDLAVSGFNGHVYVAEEGGGQAVQEFDATGAYVASWTGENTPGGQFGAELLTVAADDQSGYVYVTGHERKITYAFDSTGAYLAEFSHSYDELYNTAVDQETGKVYVSNISSSNQQVIAEVVDVFGPGIIVPDAITEPATEIDAHKAIVHGSVGPAETQLSDCRFEYDAGESYGYSTPCVPAAGTIPTDGNLHRVSAQIEGLKAGTTYHFRIVAANSVGTSTGSAESFSTLPGPSITGDTTRNLTGNTAELVAQINPEGAETTYHFEYDTRPYEAGEAPHGKVVDGSEGTIATGAEPQSVSATLTKLVASITYYWRVIATNSREKTTGREHSFVYSANSSGLPDGRAYELVTPPAKNGALLNAGIFIAPPDISGDGTRIMTASIQCFADALSCIATRDTEGEPYSFQRTNAGWQAKALAPPPLEASGNSFFRLDADTGTALFSMPTPPLGEDDFYVREGDGSLVDIGPTTPEAQGTTTTRLYATPDFSDVAYELPGGTWPFDATLGNRRSSFELSGADNTVPSLIGVEGGAGSRTLISTCGTNVGSSSSLAIHAMSLDGSVVYFTALGHSEGAAACPSSAGAPATNELYARVDQSRTIAISQRSPSDCKTSTCRSSNPNDANFEDASADGKQVFFTDTQQLTDGASEDSSAIDTAQNCKATQYNNGCNLYEYDLASPAGHNLIAVSIGDTSGLGPQVQRVFATSDDGSHVYFVAKGVLSATANNQGVRAVAGGENLYVYERDAAYPQGHLAFVATLSTMDRNESGNNYIEAGKVAPNVTPDGRFLVFTSHADLTNDDNSTSGAAQVFQYDAESEKLVRVSIGERGFDDNGNTFRALCLPNECRQDAYIAQNPVYRRDMSMSDNGAYVFFTSPVGLTAHALNDVQISSDEGLPVFAKNVYEYHNGQVSLISDGKDTSHLGPSSAVELIGSDRTGASVFFATDDQLVPQDTDTQRDFYDARVCTITSPCIPAAAPSLASCEGEACHGTPTAAPARLAPPSDSFSGEGNIAPREAATAKSKARLKASRIARALRICRLRQNRARRTACEARAYQRYDSGRRRSMARSQSQKGGK